MANGYGSSSGSPYIRRSTNAQGQAAPAGFHYMPDGTLMSDSAHAQLYGASKTITNFVLDTNDIQQAGERRKLSVFGNKGATFSLEIRNEDDKYYNFKTNLFQTAKAQLNNAVIGSNRYTVNVTFPKVTDADKYDIYLIAEILDDTKHAEYKEVRFGDNTVDINSSTGSNSSLIQKVIYQTLDVRITLAGISPNALVTGTVGTQAITTSRNKNIANIPFAFIFTVTSLKSLVINRQPTSDDIGSYITQAIGSTPVNIKGEDIYPTVTAADKVVNGAVTSGANVTMDDDFTGLWAVGDKITGNAALDARTQDTAVTVTAVNVGSNAKVFTMSEAIAIADDEKLSFSSSRNYRWPVDNIHKFVSGLKVIKGEYFIQENVSIKEYLTQTTINEGKADEYKIDNVRVPALDTLGAFPTISRNATTNISTTTQSGEVVFSDQALFSYGGVNAKFFAYGRSEIEIMTGYDIEFSNLSVLLSNHSQVLDPLVTADSKKVVTTTTTTAPSAATSWNITSAVGIAENISTVSGIGVAPGAVDPTVTAITNIGGATWDNSGGATITVGVAQSLSSGITITCPDAGTIATIKGNMKVNKVGNEDVRIEFDVEKFLTMQAAP